MLGYFLNILFTLGYLLIETPAQLFLVQAGLGVAAALATPTWDALYASYATRKQAGMLWGLADGEASLLTGLAVIGGGLIVNYWSFDALFVIMGAIQLWAMLYLIKLLSPRERKRKK